MGDFFKSNNRNFHWILIGNLNCGSEEVEYYDSLFHGNIRNHVKMQVCNMYKSPTETLKIEVQNCQQQTNGVDCGVFAIANAYALLSGQRIPFWSIDETNMKKHLIECIDAEKFSNFPGCTLGQQHNEPKSIVIDIFCLLMWPIAINGFIKNVKIFSHVFI